MTGMQLPIDATKAPFRAKYLDETRVLSPWFEFGRHHNGRVDIADESGDIFTGVLPEHAELIIKAREEFLRVIYDAMALT